MKRNLKTIPNEDLFAFKLKQISPKLVILLSSVWFLLEIMIY